MKADASKFKTIQEYVATFPESTQRILKQLHKTIRAAAPKAEESISYNMPAFKLHGPLVYYAAYKKHIGFYPTGSGVEAFKKEITKYKSSKGAIQFPIGEPLPLALITKIVKFRVKVNVAKFKEKER